MLPATSRRPDRDEDWVDLQALWDIRPGTTYLNHGSFGPSPAPVRRARERWIRQLDSQPMDFYVRQLEPALDNARARMARWLGTSPSHLVFVENATFGMNVIADSFPLQEGDAILLNDHEYGAVHRIWKRRAAACRAEVQEASMPARFDSSAECLEHLLAAVTERTRIVVLSHVTSATGLVWPIADWIPAFRARGIAVCIDGPHAPAQLPLQLDQLDCDFYAASCHKWLCGPLGTGFLYVHPRQQQMVRTPLQSWGRLPPAQPARWDEHFTWSGTRDPSGYLALPAAVDFLESVGLDLFRARAGWLASEAERRLTELLGTTPIGDRKSGWYGTMAHVPLPIADASGLQQRLWQQHGIETPVIHFQGKWYIRVSCHLYTRLEHLDRLVSALATCLRTA